MSINVTAADANSFRASQGQIAAEMARAIDPAQRDLQVQFRGAMETLKVFAFPILQLSARPCETEPFARLHPDPKIIPARSVLAPQQEDRVMGHVQAAAFGVAPLRELAVVDRGRGHQAQRHAAAGVRRAVFFRAVGDVDVVEGHVARRQDQVLGRAPVVLGGRELAVEG